MAMAIGALDSFDDGERSHSGNKKASASLVVVLTTDLKRQHAAASTASAVAQRLATMHDNEPLWKKCARLAKEEVAAANQAAKEAREAAMATPDASASGAMTPEEAAVAKAAGAEKAKSEKAAAKAAAAEAPWWHALMEADSGTPLAPLTHAQIGANAGCGTGVSVAVASAARKARTAASKITVAESQLLLKKLARELKVPALAGGGSMNSQPSQQDPSTSAPPQGTLNNISNTGSTNSKNNYNAQMRYPPLASEADGTFWGRRDFNPGPTRDPQDPYGLLGARTAAAAQFFDDLQEPPVHTYVDPNDLLHDATTLAAVQAPTCGASGLLRHAARARMVFGLPAAPPDPWSRRRTQQSHNSLERAGSNYGASSKSKAAVPTPAIDAQMRQTWTAGLDIAAASPRASSDVSSSNDLPSPQTLFAAEIAAVQQSKQQLELSNSNTGGSSISNAASSPLPELKEGEQSKDVPRPSTAVALTPRQDDVAGGLALPPGSPAPGSPTTIGSQLQPVAEGGARSDDLNLADAATGAAGAASNGASAYTSASTGAGAGASAGQGEAGEAPAEVVPRATGAAAKADAQARKAERQRQKEAVREAAKKADRKPGEEPNWLEDMDRNQLGGTVGQLLEYWVWLGTPAGAAVANSGSGGGTSGAAAGAGGWGKSMSNNFSLGVGSSAASDGPLRMPATILADVLTRKQLAPPLPQAQQDVVNRVRAQALGGPQERAERYKRGCRKALEARANRKAARKAAAAASRKNNNNIDNSGNNSSNDNTPLPSIQGGDEEKTGAVAMGTAAAEGSAGGSNNKSSSIGGSGGWEAEVAKCVNEELDQDPRVVAAHALEVVERAATIVRLAQCTLGDILARRYLLAQRLQNTVKWPGIRSQPGDEYAVLVEEYQRVRAAVAADPTDYASAAEAVQKGALLLGPLLPIASFEGADARAELHESLEAAKTAAAASQPPATTTTPTTAKKRTPSKDSTSSSTQKSSHGEAAAAVCVVAFEEAMAAVAAHSLDPKDKASRQKCQELLWKALHAAQQEAKNNKSSEVFHRVTLRCRVELASLRFEDEREAFYNASSEPTSFSSSSASTELLQGQEKDRDSSAGAEEDKAGEYTVNDKEQKVGEEGGEKGAGIEQGDTTDENQARPMVTLEEELIELVAIHSDPTCDPYTGARRPYLGAPSPWAPPKKKKGEEYQPSSPQSPSSSSLYLEHDAPVPEVDELECMLAQVSLWSRTSVPKAPSTKSLVILQGDTDSNGDSTTSLGNNNNNSNKKKSDSALAAPFEGDGSKDIPEQAGSSATASGLPRLAAAHAHYRSLSGRESGTSSSSSSASSSYPKRWLAGRRRAGPGDQLLPGEALAWVRKECDDLALRGT